MNKANQVGQEADQNGKDITAVRQALANTVANLENYKVTDMTTVNFGLNLAKLSADDKMKLDQLASSSSSHKRYFIAVEGYTDQTGSADYNLELSKRRADAVVQYLAGQLACDNTCSPEHTCGTRPPYSLPTASSSGSTACCSMVSFCLT